MHIMCRYIILRAAFTPLEIAALSDVARADPAVAEARASSAKQIKLWGETGDDVYSAFALQEQQEQLAREEQLAEEARAAQLAAELAPSGAAEAGASSSSIDQAPVEEPQLAAGNSWNTGSVASTMGPSFIDASFVSQARRRLRRGGRRSQICIAAASAYYRLHRGGFQGPPGTFRTTTFTAPFRARNKV